jgi:hypothetical protein
LTTQSAAYTQDDPRDKRVSFSLNDAEVRDGLKLLFKLVGVQYSISPEVQGTVAVDFKDIPFELALRNILDQVRATFRVDAGVYEIVPREGSVRPTLDEAPRLPALRPGEYTSAYEIPDKSLFLSADRTYGGTADLLSLAADRAGFRVWYAYTYGDGFAFVMPVEAIGGDGRPLKGSKRFAFEPDMSNRDFQEIPQIFNADTPPSSGFYRVLVLLVAPDAIQRNGRPGWSASLSRHGGNLGLPDMARRWKWDSDPKLTVLAYEFRFQKGTAALVLRKPGEKGPDARAHAIEAGLWKADALK